MSARPQVPCACVPLQVQAPRDGIFNSPFPSAPPAPGGARGAPPALSGAALGPVAPPRPGGEGGGGGPGPERGQGRGDCNK
jgi:hypothetical protein